MNFFIRQGILKESIDFKSFQIKDSLNPEIFNDNSKMKKEVRKSLLEMAENFYDFLQFDWLAEKYSDVWLVGSMASYNWSEKYSDIDVHLIMDLSLISNHIDLLKSDLWASKTLYNDEHDLTVKNYNVELYMQDINEKIESNGIFSILKQTWIKKPVKLEHINTNQKRVSYYVGMIEKRMEEAIKQFRLGNYDEARSLNSDILEDVMNLRKEGLAEGGEFSDKNIAYKSLRRDGTMDKLNRLDILAFDKKVSIDTTNKEKLDNGEITPQKKAELPNDETSDQKNGGAEEEEDTDGYTDGINYVINGRKFNSLRQAEEKLGVAKSTIEYRVNSESDKWKGYKKLT